VVPLALPAQQARQVRQVSLGQPGRLGPQGLLAPLDKWAQLVQRALRQPLP